MRKAFISNIILLIAANAIVKPLWVLGIDRKVQLIVGDENFGAYLALFNISLLFHSLLDVGLTSVNNRAIASSAESVQQRFAETLGSKLVLLLLYFSVILLIGFLLHYSFVQLALLSLVGLLQAVSSMLLFMRSNINGLQLFKRDTILSIADKVLAIFILGAMIYISVLQKFVTITNFILVQIACIIFSLGISFYLLKGHVQFAIPPIKLNILRARIKESLPIAIAILLMFIYAKADIVLLERLHVNGEVQSAMYQKSIRVLDTLNMLAYMFAGLLLGMFSKAIAQKQHVEDLVHTSTILLIPVTCFVAGCLMVYAPFILNLFYGAADEQMVLVFRLVMSCFPALGLTAIFSTLITSANRLWLLCGIAAIGAVICVVGNLFVASKFGFIGSAIISVCTLNIVGFLYFIKCNKILAANVMWQNFRLIMLSIVSGAVLNFCLHAINAHIIIGFLCNALAASLFWWQLRKDEFTTFTQA
jgi:O-antigen/teichoic acid export membrane protein